MTSDVELKDLIEHARRDYKKRNFDQSVDLTIILKDIDVKKGFSFNEVVHLPNKPSRQATVCVVASGEMGSRARRAEADRIIEVDELDRLGTNKKEAKKLAKAYDFFLSDTALMATVGRSLGPRPPPGWPSRPWSSPHTGRGQPASAAPRRSPAPAP